MMFITDLLSFSYDVLIDVIVDCINGLIVELLFELSFRVIMYVFVWSLKCMCAPGKKL